MNKAQTATNALLGIINDILDFSKVEAGKMTLDLHPFRLDHLLRDLGVILSASIGSKQIEVLFDIEPALPAWVLGDSLRLRQILLNLSGNAIKFTEHGEVVLTVQLLPGSDAPAGTPDSVCEIAFEVKDSGIGIAKDQLDHIFTGFSQAEASTTRRFGGTGLGLAISQRLVQLMGGRLQVESEPGQGSRFYFSIKFNIPDASISSLESAQPLPPAASVQKWSRVLHTLVVDDNQLARESLCSMARSLGWSVDAATSGSEALERLQESAAEGKPYELILIDWLMPGMDGWETARQIRCQSQHERLPIVVMVTAHARALLEERNKQDTMALDGFLFKPVTTAALCDALGAIDMGTAHVLDAANPVRHQRLAGVRLLVVEDNPLNQQVAQELLSNQGAQVMLADNGQIALDILASTQHNFDLVLMDIQMPIMDGYTATRLLRQHTSPEELPIIAMTANVLASDYQDCLQAGMNDHIGKPFEITQLVEVIRRHLRLVALPESAETMTADVPMLPLPAGIRQMAEQHEFELAYALSNLNHNLPLLHTGFKLFCEDALHLSRHIPVLIQAQNLKELMQVLHTLKSTAATIGARVLSHQVMILEDNLRDGQPITELENDLNQLARQLAQKSAILASVLAVWDQATLDVPPTPSESAAHNRAALLSLIESLQTSNMAALDQHQKLQASLSILSPALAEQLQQEIDGFDFSGAAQTGQRLLTLLDGVVDD